MIDISPYITPVITVVLSISTVSAFVMSAASKSKKYIIIASDAINTLKDVRDALEDGKLTAEEQAVLTADVKKLEEDFRS